MENQLFFIKSLNGFHSDYNDVQYYIVEYENNNNKPGIVLSYMIRMDVMNNDMKQLPNMGNWDYLNEYFEKYTK